MAKQLTGRGVDLDEGFIHPDDMTRGDRIRGGLSRGIQTGLVMLLLAGIWETLSRLDPSWWPRIILPPTTEIAQAFWHAGTSELLWTNMWVTVQETLIGFVIGASAAFLLGVAIALWPAFSRAVYPLMVAFQSVPRVALGPVFIAWFGFGMSSKVALAVTICFFPVLANTVTGLAVVEENATLLMRSLKATKFQEFFYLRLPNAMPTIFAGLQSAITFALVGAVFGELLGSQEGVGQLIKAASFQLRLDDVFAYLTWLALVGISLFGIVIAVEKRVVFWAKEPAHE